jgi:hypothetical protein
MANALKIAPPPPRRSPIEDKPPSVATARAVSPPKFKQAKEDGRVQFNKRVTQRVADGFDMLAIRTRRKVPELLAEALELLEERYGKI